MPTLHITSSVTITESDLQTPLTEGEREMMDFTFWEHFKKWIERIEDRKLRKTNYRAWRAKHPKASQSTQ
jgi:hypothetical protein